MIHSGIFYTESDAQDIHSDVANDIRSAIEQIGNEELRDQLLEELSDQTNLEMLDSFLRVCEQELKYEQEGKWA